MSQLGLSHGHLHDGTPNKIDPLTGVCLVCLTNEAPAPAEEEEMSLGDALADATWVISGV
jgi:hypothetical protein